jgi:hypothetical protein
LFRKKQADKKTTLMNQACRGLDTSENPVRAVAGCDLLTLLFEKAKSKDRSLRRLLQGNGLPGRPAPTNAKGPEGPFFVPAA